MQESRLFQILYYLLERGHATAPELAEKFEVSVRTIYRDIDVLSGAGIPVYVTAGRSGGIRFLDGYVLDKSLFSDSEQQVILSGLQSLSAVQNPEEDAILRKLGAVFQTSITDWISVDFSRWGSAAEKENRLFREIKQAIFESRQISFDYYNSNGEHTSRDVHPGKLVYRDKAWYLYGFCLSREEYRLFRLTRIKNLSLTEQHFTRSMEKVGTVFPKVQDMGEPVELELECSLETGYKLFDILEDSAIRKQDDSYLVKLTLPENEWLYDFLLSFGSRVTVLRPESVRRRLTERCEAALNHHKGVEQ